MAKTTLPPLAARALEEIEGTLSTPRLSKYLRVTQGRRQAALRLYVLNTRVGAALFADLHYVEIALRNRFDAQLATRYGPQWFDDPAFRSLINSGTEKLIGKARANAAKFWPREILLPPGKVIAELTFGFWQALTERRLEHTLWVPYLHKAFLPRKAPKRVDFNHRLETLRLLRNRVAHHEPVFHLDLKQASTLVFDVARSLCPATATLVETTSSTRREIMRITNFNRRRSL